MGEGAKLCSLAAFDPNWLVNVTMPFSTRTIFFYLMSIVALNVVFLVLFVLSQQMISRILARAI